ncbi:hypothetical protein BB560_005982, partial [Smittium megazygosporum]
MYINGVHSTEPLSMLSKFFENSQSQRREIIVFFISLLLVYTLLNKIHKLGIGLQLNNVTNSKGSRRVGTEMGRMIDHILHNDALNPPNYCIIAHAMDLSDHLPVQAEWNIDKLVVEKPKPKINIKKIQENSDLFINNNRFSVLAELESTQNVDEISSKFTEIIHETANQFTNETPAASFTTILSKTTRKMIDKRRKLYKNMLKNKDLINEYLELKQKSTKRIKKDIRKHYQEQLMQVSEYYLNKNSKKL